MRLFASIAATSAVIGTSLFTINPVEAGACYTSLIVDDMNMLVMEGKSVSDAWQEQVRLGNSDSSDYCWRQTKSTLMTFKSIKPALYNAVFR